MFQSIQLSCFLSTVYRKMSTSRKPLIAVCQMTSTGNREANFCVVEELTRQAKDRQASIVFFPEGCDYIAASHAETKALAEDEDGPYLQKYKELAKNNSIWISLGGIHLSIDSSEKLSNSSLLINPSGNIMARYDKTHLFDVDIPEKNVKLLESKYVEKGMNIIPPLETTAGKVGLAICYDMRFPEIGLTLRKMGADILTYPSAFTFETGASHWRTLLTARAVETQCYVIAAAQTGAHNQKRRSWGHAVVVDPWGSVIAECKEGTGIALAEIDLEYLAEVRRNMPVQLHRRTDLYPGMPGVVEEQALYKFGQVMVTRESVFYTSHLSIAFTNKRCVVPGHVLIAPIRDVPRFSNLTQDEVADLFQVAQKVATVMEKKTGATSSTIVVQDGPEAGQTIRQVHVHILPRRASDFQRNDDIYDVLQRHDDDEEKPWRSEEEMRAEADEIRQFFKSLVEGSKAV